MFVAKNNEPFSMRDGFSKIISRMSPDREIANKHGAGKTEITQIKIVGKGNQFWVLKKINVYRVCLRR